MFHLTCFGWLIFRAKTSPQIGTLVAALFGHFAPRAEALSTYALPVVFYTALLLAVDAFEAHRDDLAAIFRLPAPVRYSVYAAMFYLTVLFGDFAGAQFIYFQF
jgi:hypothetical protein